MHLPPPLTALERPGERLEQSTLCRRRKFTWGPFLLNHLPFSPFLNVCSLSHIVNIHCFLCPSVSPVRPAAAAASPPSCLLTARPVPPSLHRSPASRPGASRTSAGAAANSGLVRTRLPKEVERPYGFERVPARRSSKTSGTLFENASYLTVCLGTPRRPAPATATDSRKNQETVERPPKGDVDVYGCWRAAPVPALHQPHRLHDLPTSPRHASRFGRKPHQRLREPLPTSGLLRPDP